MVTFEILFHGITQITWLYPYYLMYLLRIISLSFFCKPFLYVCLSCVTTIIYVFVSLRFSLMLPRWCSKVMDVFIKAAEYMEIPVRRTDEESLQKLFVLVRSELNLDPRNIRQEQAKFWKQHPALVKVMCLLFTSLKALVGVSFLYSWFPPAEWVVDSSPFDSWDCSIVAIFATRSQTDACPCTSASWRIDEGIFISVWPMAILYLSTLLLKSCFSFSFSFSVELFLYDLFVYGAFTSHWRFSGEISE